MVKMFKIRIKGLKNNAFVEPGVWVTEKELNLLMDRQYDEKMFDKVINLGGRFFKPRDFEGVIEEKTLSELCKDGSPLFDGKSIESLAKAGYLGEIVENCPLGYRQLVDKLVASGQYQLESGEEEKVESSNQISEMKAKLLSEKSFK